MADTRAIHLFQGDHTETVCLFYSSVACLSQLIWIYFLSFERQPSAQCGTSSRVHDTGCCGIVNNQTLTSTGYSVIYFISLGLCHIVIVFFKLFHLWLMNSRWVSLSWFNSSSTSFKQKDIIWELICIGWVGFDHTWLLFFRKWIKWCGKHIRRSSPEKVYRTNAFFALFPNAVVIR